MHISKAQRRREAAQAPSLRARFYGVFCVSHAVLAAFFLLSAALWLSDGQYTVPALRLTVAAFGCLLLAAWLAVRRGMGDTPQPVAIVLVAAILFLLSIRREPGIYLAGEGYLALAQAVSLGMILVLLAGYLITPVEGNSWCTRLRNAVFGLSVGLLCLLQLGMPMASPVPAIDVWTTAQDSAQHLLSGQNPYATPVSKIYGEGEVFGYVLKAYNYLPANLELQTPAYALFGDVRYALIMALWVFLGTLWLLSAGLPLAERQLLLLLALAQPRLLFVIEQAWTEPFILAAFGLMLLAHQRGWRLRSALAYGAMLSLKQYVLFFAFHWLILERRWTFLAAGVALAGLTLLPFVLWDPLRLWSEGVLFQLQTGFRSDSLTIASVFYREFGLEAPKWWTVVVGAVAAVAGPYALRSLEPLSRYLFSVTITTFALFLFGSQAFMNYYFLVGGLLLCLLTIVPRRA